MELAVKEEFEYPYYDSSLLESFIHIDHTYYKIVSDCFSQHLNNLQHESASIKVEIKEDRSADEIVTEECKLHIPLGISHVETKAERVAAVSSLLDNDSNNCYEVLENIKKEISESNVIHETLDFFVLGANTIPGSSVVKANYAFVSHDHNYHLIMSNNIKSEPCDDPAMNVEVKSEPNALFMEEGFIRTDNDNDLANLTQRNQEIVRENTRSEIVDVDLQKRMALSERIKSEHIVTECEVMSLVRPCSVRLRRLSFLVKDTRNSRRDCNRAIGFESGKKDVSFRESLVGSFSDIEVKQEKHQTEETRNVYDRYEDFGFESEQEDDMEPHDTPVPDCIDVNTIKHLKEKSISAMKSCFVKLKKVKVHHKKIIKEEKTDNNEKMIIECKAERRRILKPIENNPSCDPNQICSKTSYKKCGHSCTENINTFQCALCEKLFSLKRSLTKHILAHLRRKPLTCHFCNRILYSKHGMVRHMKLHNNNKLTCAYCDHTFTRPDHLERHTRTHTDEKPFQCSYCKRPFAAKYYLALHMATHTSEKHFKCGICAKAFVTKFHLMVHIKHHHLKKHRKTGQMCKLSENKPFKCRHCSSGFSKKWHLADHMILHTGKGLFPCEICGRAYTQKSNLKYHMATHSKVKSYICRTCGAAFKQKCLLAGHMKSHLYNLQCDLCLRFFNRKSTLLCHIRVHLKMRPFKCKICPCTYARRSHLNSHINLLHKK